MIHFFLDKCFLACSKEDKIVTVVVSQVLKGYKNSIKENDLYSTNQLLNELILTLSFLLIGKDVFLIMNMDFHS